MKNILIYILLSLPLIANGQTNPWPMPFGNAYSYWATLNPRDKTDASTILYGGNLRVHSSGGYRCVRSTIGVSSASANPKVHWEITMNASSSGPAMGVALITSAISPSSVSSFPGYDTKSWGFINSGGTGLKVANSVQTAYGPSLAVGDIIIFEYDATSGTLNMWRKRSSTLTSYGTMFTGLSGTMYPELGTYGGNSYDYTVNFGASAWAMTPTTTFVGIHH